MKPALLFALLTSLCTVLFVASLITGPAATGPVEALRALLQMSRFSPRYDSGIAGPPVALQKVFYWTIGPIARLLGYRSRYPRFAPNGSR